MFIFTFQIQDSPIMSAETALTPSVSWAQRPKIVFVTINVSDVENPDIKVKHKKAYITRLQPTVFH